MIVSFQYEPSIESLENLAGDLKSGFPQAQRINALSATIGPVEPGGAFASTTSSSAIGFRLTNPKGDRVLQVRKQGFSYSHLHPYTKWPTFIAEMRPLWEQYMGALRPASVTRMAVRYINRILVPQGVDLDLYLNVTPRLLTNVCNEVEGYFLQLVLPQRDLGNEWKAILNTGLEPSPASDVMSVLLDIDVFCEKTFPIDSDNMWNVLSQLRDRKNLIFESAITDEVRRIIE